MDQGSPWMFYSTLATAIATIFMALATIAIAIAAAYQAKFSKQLASLQQSLEEERRRVAVGANIKWPQLGLVQIELVNFSPSGLAVSDVTLHAFEFGTKEKRKIGIQGTFAAKPFEPVVIPGYIPLREIVKDFGTDNRTAVIVTVQFSAWAPHGQLRAHGVTVFEGILERDAAGNIYPVSFGIPSPPAFA